jgi:hypothetical protein
VKTWPAACFQLTTAVVSQMPMNEIEQNKSIEYQSRYQFWSDRAVAQFSFSNNLLLTISIATLGYFFKEGSQRFSEIKIWFIQPGEFDLNATLFSLGTIFTVLSITFGLVASMSRLYDFNLTRHISLIRKRVYDNHKNKFPNISPADKKTLESFFDLLKVLFRFEKIKILRSDCENFDQALRDKFLNLRSITAGFGRLSWILFTYQFSCFLIGFFLYTWLMI